MPTTLPASNSFRKALSAGAFRQAEDFLQAYRADVVRAWQAAESDRERREIANEVTAVLEWARTATLSLRSHAQHRLILLGRESAYTPHVENPELRGMKA